MVGGALGSETSFSRTLVKSVPLLLVALGLIIAWRAEMFSIGGEGQLLIGGVAGASLAALFPTLWPPLLLLLILCASIFGGFLYGGFAGWLSVRKRVQIVVSTILLNFIAVQFLEWSVRGPLQNPEQKVPLSRPLSPEVMLPKLHPQWESHLGVPIALIAAVVVFVILFRTKWGFQLRVVGASPGAARSNWIRSDRVRLQAMLFSGGLCGFAGGIEYAGITGQVGSGFSQQWGYLAIPVALLAALHPLLAVVTSVYFGAMLAGSETLARFTQASGTIVYIVQGAAVLGYLLLLHLRNRSLPFTVDNVSDTVDEVPQWK